MRRVLVIGAAGLLGAHLYRECSRRWASAGTCFRFAQTGLRRLDISDARQVHAGIAGFEPEIIFLTGALTHVALYVDLSTLRLYQGTHHIQSKAIAVNVLGVVIVHPVKLFKDHGLLVLRNAHAAVGY